MIRPLTKYTIQLELETSEGGDGRWTALCYDEGKRYSGRGYTINEAIDILFAQVTETPEED
jgi:hypothetical protein